MPSLGGDSYRDRRQSGSGGTSTRLKVVQLGYNLRAELRQKLLPFSTTPSASFEGVRARVETVAHRSHQRRRSGIPVGGGDMIRDAGKSEDGLLGDSFFSDSAGPSVRELLTYHLLQTAPYLITRFRLPTIVWCYRRSFESQSTTCACLAMRLPPRRLGRWPMPSLVCSCGAAGARPLGA